MQVATLSTDVRPGVLAAQAARDGGRVDTPLDRFAAAHDGVVTADAAARLGYDGSRLRTFMSAGGWRPIRYAAYLAPWAEDTLRARVRAVQLRHPALVASHRTAAALLGGDLLTPGFDFTVDGGGRHDVSDGNLFRWGLRTGDVVDAAGLRVTSAARTATDLLRARPRDEAVVTVDALLRNGLRLDAVAGALADAHGTRHIRRAWTAYRLLDPRSGSVAESKARLVLRDAGFAPRSQVVVVDEPGRRIRVDLWVAPGVVVEVEGRAFHGTREQHQADIARFNALARVPGIVALRFSWADVFHRPALLVSAVRAAVARLTDATAAPTGGYVRAGAADR